MNHRQGRWRRAWIWSVSILSTTALLLLVLLGVSLHHSDDRLSAIGARAVTPKAGEGGGSKHSRTSAPSDPTSTPTTSLSTAADHVSPFGQQTAGYLSSRTGDITAAVYDIDSGQSWIYHPGDVQDTASIVKVDIMATLMAQLTASNKPLSSSDTSLLTSMIEVSDNDSATALWNAVGGPSAISQFDFSIGMTETTPSLCLSCAGFSWPGWGLTTTTAADQITLLRQLALPGGPIADPQREKALSLLENITPSEDWGVSRGVPAGVAIALKNGWVPLPDGLWQIDSIGWIDGGGRDYLVAVLTNGNPTEGYGIDTIDSLSSMIWAALGPPAS